MKRKIWVWILGGLLIALILIVGGVIIYLRFALPNVPLKNISVQSTPERIMHGKYLANHVTVCMDCHSPRDWERFSGPPVAGTLGRGGEIFDQKLGFPGSFSSPNITPYRLREWSDAEIYRAITSGVSRDGRALFPIMPYPAYSTLDSEDIYSIIAYIRSIPDISYNPPVSDPAFPMNLVVRTFPSPARPLPRPSPSDTLKYGEYLVKAAGCIECHTPAVHGQIDKSHAFTGGREFQLPNGLLTSPNITPDEETGIGRLTRDDFVRRIMAYEPSAYTPPKIKAGDMQSIMPWTMYGGMESTDLGAIYTYLRSLAPVKYAVVRFRPVK